MKLRSLFAVSVATACAATLVVFGYKHLERERNDLIELINATSFYDKVDAFHGISINYIRTAKRAYFTDFRPITVLIDPSTDRIYADHIRDIYAFFSLVSGIPINIEIAQKGKGFAGQKYFYVGSAYDTDTSGDRKSAFVEFLRSDLTKEFPNQDPEPVWKDLESKMGDYAGKPLFFNSEFGKIDFNKVASGEKYRLVDTNIDKSAIFVSSSPIPDYGGGEFISYVRMFIDQEAIQDFNLNSDSLDQRYQLRTLLYDHDMQMWGLKGAERARERVKHAATGFCPLDVMTTMIIARSYGRPLTREDTDISRFIFLRDYALSYYYYLRSPKTLFDERCW